MKKQQLLVCLVMGFVLLLSHTSVGATITTPKEVADLQIGVKDYVIGQILNDKQKSRAASALLENAFAGTYKFMDGDLLVVVAEGSDMVMAIRKKFKKSHGDDFRNIVKGLMDDFGEPTTMAHEKIIYWAYNKGGKIPEEKYLEAKDNGKLDAILTVKLNSSEEFADVTGEQKKLTETYLLISSGPLLEQFVAMVGK